jgi:hypothetical protein
MVHVPVIFRLEEYAKQHRKEQVKLTLSLIADAPRHEDTREQQTEVSGQVHAPAALSPGKETPGTLWIQGWVGHKPV